MMVKQIIVVISFPFLLQAQFGPGGVGNSSDNGLWVKADDITGLNDGDNVTSWNDRSGNANNVTNSVLRNWVSSKCRA